MRQPFLENLYSFCKAQLQDPHCLWPIPCPLLQPWQRAHLCPQSFTSPATAALTWPHFYPGSLQDYLFLQLLQPCNLTGKISEQQSLIVLAYEREETTTNISEIINRFRFKLGYFLPTPVTCHWVCASRKLECLEILIYYWGGEPMPCHVYEGQRKPFRRGCFPSAVQRLAVTTLLPSDHHSSPGRFLDREYIRFLFVFYKLVHARAQ